MQLKTLEKSILQKLNHNNNDLDFSDQAERNTMMTSDDDGAKSQVVSKYKPNERITFDFTSSQIRMKRLEEKVDII